MLEQPLCVQLWYRPGEAGRAQLLVEADKGPGPPGEGDKGQGPPEEEDRLVVQDTQEADLYCNPLLELPCYCYKIQVISSFGIHVDGMLINEGCYWMEKTENYYTGDSR